MHRKNNNTMGRYFKLDTEAMLKDLAQGTLKKAKEIGSLIQEEVVELKKEFEETVKEYQEEQKVEKRETARSDNNTEVWKTGDKVRFICGTWEVYNDRGWFLWPDNYEDVFDNHNYIEKIKLMFEETTGITFDKIVKLCGGDHVGKLTPYFPNVQFLMKFVKKMNELYDNACGKDKPATKEKPQSGTNETGNMTTITIPTKLCKKLQYLALIPDPENPYSNCRTYNEGKSDYSKHLIQTWTIWQDYPELDPWQKDIIKRTLRRKTKEDEILDAKKIIHICNERLRQLEYEK